MGEKTDYEWDQNRWDLHALQRENRALLNSQHVNLALIEELRHHGQDIQQVVTWLHDHAPERFDARLSMGQLITGILDEWLYLRRTSLRHRLGRILDSLVRKPKPKPQSQENGEQDDC